MADKKTVSAKEVAADIRAGADDEYLITKYELSPKGLESLFKKLVAAGILSQADLNRRRAEEPESVEVEVLEDGSESVPNWNPITKDSLSRLGQTASDSSRQEGKHVSQAPTSTQVVFKCPACGLPQSYDFKMCPQCGIYVEKYLERETQKSTPKEPTKAEEPKPDKRAVSSSRHTRDIQTKIKKAFGITLHNARKTAIAGIVLAAISLTWLALVPNNKKFVSQSSTLQPEQSAKSTKLQPSPELRSSDYRTRVERLCALVNTLDDASSRQDLESMYKDAASVKWLHYAGEHGEAVAQFLLGRMFDLGIGISQNNTEAVNWYRKAAEQGYAPAQTSLGVMYNVGRGVSKDYSEALKWYRKAAEQGYAKAQTNLGVMYNDGEGVGKDYSEALRWYRRAAEQGYARAQNILGAMYSNGEGVGKDYSEALKWFNRAAEQGCAMAQKNLGVMYENGRGVNKDCSEAVNWYRKAAEQGYARAQDILGVMYSNGEGVGKDYSEAVKWFKKAAEQGDANAQLKLGDMYSRGAGVLKDTSEARKWLTKSAEQGNEMAKKYLLVLSETLSNGQSGISSPCEALKEYMARFVKIWQRSPGPKRCREDDYECQKQVVLEREQKLIDWSQGTRTDELQKQVNDLKRNYESVLGKVPESVRQSLKAWEFSVMVCYDLKDFEECARLRKDENIAVVILRMCEKYSSSR